jgi:hypothetical protein
MNTSRRQREMQPFPSLVTICQAKVFEILKENRSNGRLIKQLSRTCPDSLMEPIFDRLLEQNVLITEVVLVSYFTPYRTSIKINHAIHIRNSLFKLIGLNCRQLVRFSFICQLSVFLRRHRTNCSFPYSTILIYPTAFKFPTQ